MAECGDDGWPFVTNGMCCPTDATPFVLAGGTTVLCCPSQADCTIIEPTICGLKYYDPHPARGSPPSIATIFTGRELDECGVLCCPWGFVCDELEDHTEVCRMLDDQSRQPDGSASTAITDITTTTSSSKSTSATSQRSPVSTLSSSSKATSTETAGSDAGNKAGLGVPATAGIAVSGVVVAALVSGFSFWLYLGWRRRRRREKRQAQERAMNSSGGADADAYAGTGINMPSVATTMDEAAARENKPDWFSGWGPGTSPPLSGHDGGVARYSVRAYYGGDREGGK